MPNEVCDPPAGASIRRTVSAPIPWSGLRRRRWEASAFRGRREAQFRRHVDEVGERGRFHLPHHPSAMCLDDDLADAELVADLLVEPAGNDQAHDLLL